MKLGLTFLLAGILLSACTDSKENADIVITDSPRTATRSIATDYQVTDPEQGSSGSQTVDCLFRLDGSTEKLSLLPGQHVSLANKETTTIIKAGASWLAVLTDDHPELPCYIQTKYLEPVPVY